MARPLPAPRPRNLILGACVVGALATLLISVLPGLDFAYRSRSAHVAIETAATVIGLLGAYLMYGRLERSASRRDLLLMGALVVLAGTNLGFSTVPSLYEGRPGPFETWSPALGRLLGAVLLAAAAVLPEARVRDVARDSRLMLLACGAALLAIGGAVAIFGGNLPKGIDPGIGPEDSGRPRIVGNPVVLALQVVGMMLYAAAAIGLTRRAVRTADELIAWFAAGAVLGAFARLNYFLFPSLYSDWVYTGDLLRLGFYLLLFAGAVREIGAYQRRLAEAAVLDERRRMARDLHDGLAQDLAFIASQSRRLEGGSSAELAEQISQTALRALEESRQAISALTRPGDEAFDVSLAHAAEEVAGRAGASLRLEIEAGLAVPLAARGALIRIVREAVTNAVRHGGAGTVIVRLERDEGLRLTVSDDGRGFDPGEPKSLGHGLTSMRERAEALGGTFALAADPGRGARVEVRLP